jgi:hypothetical protein
MMRHYQIPYHKSTLSLKIPEKNLHYYVDLELPPSDMRNKDILSEAINQSDSISLGHHPLHPDPKRRDNPLAKDMWEAYQLISAGPPTYVIAPFPRKGKFSGVGLVF